MKKLLFLGVLVSCFGFAEAASKDDSQKDYTIVLNNDTGRDIIVNFGNGKGNLITSAFVPKSGRKSKQSFIYTYPADQSVLDKWKDRKIFVIKWAEDVARDTARGTVSLDDAMGRNLLKEKSVFKFNPPKDGQKYMRADIVLFRPKDFKKATTPELIKSAAALQKDIDAGKVSKDYGVPGIQPVKNPGAGNVITSAGFVNGDWWWRYLSEEPSKDNEPDLMSKKEYKSYLDYLSQTDGK